jgi:hypothetical protein
MHDWRDIRGMMARLALLVLPAACLRRWGSGFSRRIRGWRGIGFGVSLGGCMIVVVRGFRVGMVHNGMISRMEFLYEYFPSFFFTLFVGIWDWEESASSVLVLDEMR